ncbi:MAG: hypothetical protein VXY77_00670 [Pseudomonadota bacterium]|nr:hypothetical protein [Pseudomonadota bacterium]
MQPLEQSKATKSGQLHDKAQPHCRSIPSPLKPILKQIGMAQQSKQFRTASKGVRFCEDIKNVVRKTKATGKPVPNTHSDKTKAHRLWRHLSNRIKRFVKTILSVLSLLAQWVMSCWHCLKRLCKKLSNDTTRKFNALYVWFRGQTNRGKISPGADIIDDPKANQKKQVGATSTCIMGSPNIKPVNSAHLIQSESAAQVDHAGKTNDSRTKIDSELAPPLEGGTQAPSQSSTESSTIPGLSITRLTASSISDRLPNPVHVLRWCLSLLDVFSRDSLQDKPATSPPLSQFKPLILSAVDQYVAKNSQVPTIQDYLKHYQLSNPIKNHLIDPKLNPPIRWSEAIDRQVGGSRDQLCIDALAQLSRNDAQPYEQILSCFLDAYGAVSNIDAFKSLQDKIRGEDDGATHELIDIMAIKLFESIDKLASQGYIQIPDWAQGGYDKYWPWVMVEASETDHHPSGSMAVN